MRPILLLTCLALSLTACNGGKNNTPPDPDPPPPNQWGHETIGVNYAHTRGLTGEGVEVGIADSFFQGATDGLDDAGKFTCIATNGVCTTNDHEGLQQHGYWVANVLAGDKDDETIYGVAYNARVRFNPLSFPKPSNDRRYKHYQPNTGQSSYFVFSLASLHDSAVVNLSFGFSNLASTPYARTNGRAVLASLKNAITVNEGNPDKERAIYVASASNNYGRVVAPTADFSNNSQIPANNITSCTDKNGVSRQCLIADSPNVAAALAYYYPEEASGYWIASVAIDEAGEIAFFSNHCGIVGDNCIAAPGVDIETRDDFGDTKTVSGTSFSAPYTSGALILLIEYFTKDETEALSRKEITERLFATADKSGNYAPDSILVYDVAVNCKLPTSTDDSDTRTECTPTDRILSDACKPIDSTDDSDTRTLCTFSKIYGQGVVDLENALTPQGEMQFARGLSLGNGFRPFAGSHLAGAPAFGDALGLSDINITLFDNLNAPFDYPLAGFAKSIESVSLLASESVFVRNRVFGKTQALWNGWEAKGGAAEASASPFVRLALGGQTTRLRAGAWEAGFFGKEGERALYGLRAGWQSKKNTARFEAGFLHEEKGILGGFVEGGFGKHQGSDHFFAGAERDWDLGGHTRFTLRGDIGWSRAFLGGGFVVQKLTPLLTSAWKAEFTHDAPLAGMWKLSLAQALRVEQGEAELAYATGRTAAGEIRTQKASVSLVPSGRALALGLAYELHHTKGSTKLGARYVHQAHHQKGLEERALFLVHARRF